MTTTIPSHHNDAWKISAFEISLLFIHVNSINGSRSCWCLQQEVGLSACVLRIYIFAFCNAKMWIDFEFFQVFRQQILSTSHTLKMTDNVSSKEEVHRLKEQCRDMCSFRIIFFSRAVFKGSFVCSRFAASESMSLEKPALQILASSCRYLCSWLKARPPDEQSGGLNCVFCFQKSILRDCGCQSCVYFELMHSVLRADFLLIFIFGHLDQLLAEDWSDFSWVARFIKSYASQG